jgi:hypothetical protein
MASGGLFVNLHFPLDAMHRPGAEPDYLGDLQDPGTLAQLALRLAFKLAGDRRPAQMLALSHCPLETELYPLLDHGSLEFGKRSGDLEHQLAGRCGGVDGLLI